MKVCAACHTDLPKDNYSKKQWKLDECQRRCKVCIADNREVQPIPKQDDDESNTGDITKTLDSMYLENVGKSSDEELFKQRPSQYGDCPVCFLRLPTLNSGWRYMSCCGKEICSGCFYAQVYDNQGNIVEKRVCPFCRIPTPTSEKEAIKREKKRVDLGDAHAIYNHGVYYRDGENRFSIDHTEALELWHRAGELGCAAAYLNIGYAYKRGKGVEVDETKATYYYELAAMQGDAHARYNLGNNEAFAGNIDRGLKHHMIAARDGYSDSLEMIKQMYSKGFATKEDYTKALQSYQAYLDEIKSRQRDEAAATNANYPMEYANCRYY